MSDPTNPVPCAQCQKLAPRDEMFGIEPDLTCPSCAQGIRERMRVRTRPVLKTHTPRVIVGCMAACLVFYVAFLMRGQGGRAEWVEALLANEKVWLGGWWPHITTVFMHFAIWHIGMNLLATWYYGRILESAWGPRVTAMVVLLTGVGASAVQFAAAGGGIGFSGALFGILGFMWGQRKHHPAAYATMDQRERNHIITMMVVMVILTETGRMNIGNWAHGGGFAVGWLLGQGWTPTRRRWAVPAVVALVVALVVGAQHYAFGTTRITESNAIGEQRVTEWKRQDWRTFVIERDAGR